MTIKSQQIDFEGTKYYIGLDIGSVSLNTVLLDEKNTIIADHYDYVHGRPFEVLHERLTEILQRFKPESIRGIAVTEPEVNWLSP
jgi:activator of 2-hydroxyglutaryl-CoA dehydratase